MYILRAAKTEDFNFIANSYLKSYRSAPANRALINEIYFPVHKARLEHMTRSGAILVACSHDDEDQIWGYAIAGELGGYPLLHYVYVKHPFRHVGVATKLITAILPRFAIDVTVVTHQAKNWSDIAKKYKLIYDPRYGGETL